MPNFAESSSRSVAQLHGEIEVLREMLLAIAAELPERAILHLERTADTLREEAEQTQQTAANEADRAYAEAAMHAAAEIGDWLGTTRLEIAQGARVRTIMPHPVDPSDELSEKGF